MNLKWHLSLCVFSMFKMGHFARECRAPRNKEGQFRNQDNTRKHGNNKDTSSKAMLAIDGVGFDWSDMAEEQYDDLIVKLNQTEFIAATYKRGLTTIEEQLITYRKNEVLFSEEVVVLKREVACKDYEINVLKSEFEKLKQEKKGIKFKIEKFDKASKDLEKLLGSQITNKSKKGLGYNVVPPLHPLIYNRPKKLDLSYSGLDEFKKPEFKGYGSENSKQESNIVSDKKSDDSKENSDESFIKEQVSKDTNFKEFDGGYVTFGGGAHGGRISGKETLKTDSLDFEDGATRALVRLKLLNPILSPLFTGVSLLTTKDETREILKNFIKEIENLVDKKVKIIRSDDEKKFKNKFMDDFCREKEAVSTACYVQNKVLVVKPHYKTPYKLFRVMKFLCWIIPGVVKAFRGINIEPRGYEENLHIWFLENKAMIEGNGPKWLFDIDSLTQSMNYVPIAAGTITNESACTLKEFNAGTSTQKEEISQDYIVMSIWKDASYFDSSSKDFGNVEPKSVADDQKHVKDGLDNESNEKDKSDDDSSHKEVNTVGQHINTTNPEVNIGRFKLNTIDPSVNTASSNDQDSPKDMFTMGASHTFEATNVEFLVIHKDHPIENVIGDVKSSIQKRRMTKSTSEQGFFSAVYEQKTHDTLNTCLYACFLSQIEPTSIAKDLSDSSWVEEKQEELLQFKLQ
ncbi:putative ribonuclease H-like domain-containing protein [Tanacetum coccineum]|uniref:Ribonuclease H-like domain-containing protein n=1 Tax=Tanacetum coccineum TaxID=301880 RepID=A0ABQ5IAB8_9ASTR